MRFRVQSIDLVGIRRKRCIYKALFTFKCIHSPFLFLLTSGKIQTFVNSTINAIKNWAAWENINCAFRRPYVIVGPLFLSNKFLYISHTLHHSSRRIHQSYVLPYHKLDKRFQVYMITFDYIYNIRVDTFHVLFLYITVPVYFVKFSQWNVSL